MPCSPRAASPTGTVRTVRWWKWLGLAGLLGVATTAGVIAVQRSRARSWTEYTPDEMRERLHERLAAADGA